ncbi:YfcL family protein [Salinicola avicenniae]|uniref:YfcL family protein n=1 Tax=Salinicola avicenniae TaxID=2916836 RepID=UPI00207339E6|nr:MULTISPECIES: YfcL family protein [unclassified Salinicola]
MSDPFAQRARSVQETLLAMEANADDQDLFALGYMIPQIGLVQEMAEYDPADVTPEDFDATYWQWLESTFAQDNMSEADRDQIAALWQTAVARTGR